MEFIGKIKQVFDKRTGTSKKGNQWASQKYLISDEQDYPQSLVFEAWGAEKIQQFNLHEGDLVKVYLSSAVNDYQGNCYNQIRAWKVERISGIPKQETPQQEAPKKQGQHGQDGQQEQDGLPF